MRIFSNPVFGQSGYPWLGVVKLAMDSSIKEGAKGKFWVGFGVFEKAPRELRGDKGGTMNMNAFSGVADKCREWPKGTMLFVCGRLIKDDYHSKPDDTVYKLVVEFIAEQLDYATMHTNDHGAKKYETETVTEYEDGVSGADYVPDF